MLGKGSYNGGEACFHNLWLSLAVCEAVVYCLVQVMEGDLGVVLRYLVEDLLEEGRVERSRPPHVDIDALEVFYARVVSCRAHYGV